MIFTYIMGSKIFSDAAVVSIGELWRIVFIIKKIVHIDIVHISLYALKIYILLKLIGGLLLLSLFIIWVKVSSNSYVAIARQDIFFFASINVQVVRSIYIIFFIFIICLFQPRMAQN